MANQEFDHRKPNCVHRVGTVVVLQALPLLGLQRGDELCRRWRWVETWKNMCGMMIKIWEHIGKMMICIILIKDFNGKI